MTQRFGYITDYLKQNAITTPDKPALVCQDRTVSWGELDDLTNQAARALSKRLTGDSQQVVALLLPNGWQFVVAYFAILRCGHIAMPLDPAYKPLELEAIISQIPPAITIIGRSADEALKPHIINEVSIDELLGEKNTTTKIKSVRLGVKKQVATLLFTSGTTGKPKATPYTHSNHIWNIYVSSKVWGWTSDDTLLISLPFSHWHGLVMGLSGAVYHGNTLYVHDRFDAEKTLETLASGKISIYTHVSIAYLKMVQFEPKRRFDLSKVRLCISASSALPPAIWEEFRQRFGVEIIECYGASETGRVASNTLEERLTGSPGRPLPGVQTKIAPSGELLIKSPGLFPGYYHNNLATKSKLTADGWWHTGDIVEMRDGHIILKGRSMERIKKQGFTLYPRDIEWALLQHPKVKEAFVLGIQQADNPSDQLIYFIAGNISEDEVMAYAKEQLPYAWRANTIIITPELPKTRSGKPELAKLRKLLNTAVVA